MSIHYEWLSAAHTYVEYVPPGIDVTTGEEVVGAPDFADEGVAEAGALTLSIDECVVIEGTIEELRALAQRMLDALPTSAEVVRHHRGG